MADEQQQTQEAPREKRELGAFRYRVTCPNHGVLGESDSVEDAHKKAAEHFHLAHPALVRDNLDNLQLEVSEFTTFRVADAAQFEKPPEPEISPGKLVTKTNV